MSSGEKRASEFLSSFRPDRAREDLEILASAAFAGRRAGSAGHDQAVTWLASHMAELGLEVALQEFKIDRVLDVYEPPRLEVQDVEGGSPRRLELRTEIAEHPRSADGPVLRSGPARNLRDGPTAGAWLIIEAVPQGPELDDFAARLRDEGAIGILAPQDAGPGGFLAKRLMGGATVGLPVLAVRSDLLPSLAGRIVSGRVPMMNRSAIGTNILGSLSARAGDKRYPILLTAHFDGVGDDSVETRLPSAADNASGVAVLLEVARVVAEFGGLSIPLCLGALDAEELSAQGSAAHARSLQAADEHPSVLNLDMAGQFHGSVAIEAGPLGVDLVAALDGAGRQLGIPLQLGPVASDNRRYAEAGFPAVGMGLGAAAYHSPADRPETVDDEALAVAGRLILATLAELDTAATLVAKHGS